MNIKFSDIGGIRYTEVTFAKGYVPFFVYLWNGCKTIYLSDLKREAEVNRRQFFGVNFSMKVFKVREHDVSIHYVIESTKPELANIVGDVRNIWRRKIKSCDIEVSKWIPYLIGLFYTSVRAILER